MNSRNLHFLQALQAFFHARSPKVTAIDRSQDQPGGYTLGLLLGRKAMTNIDSILKSRDITLSTKVHLVKAMVFPVVCMDVRVGL